MAAYDYFCSSCGHVHEEIHSMNESPVFYCPECNKKLERKFSLSVGFIIKGGTEATHWKEKRSRMSRREELGVRQVERYGTGSKLRPNVAGMETDNWSDAAKLAGEAGMSTESYEPMIEKENRTSKSSGMDDAVWKAAKEGV